MKHWRRIRVNAIEKRTMRDRLSMLRELKKLSSLAVLVLVLPLASACRPSLGTGVARHDTATLTSEQAQQIVGDGWQVLDTDDGGGDVRCNVEALRTLPTTSITPFTAGTGVINGEADYDAVLEGPGFVKVVNEINWCGTLLGGLLGCTPMGGRGMVVVRYTPSDEGVLWAHEYGHTRGNPDVGPATRVMSSAVYPVSRTVTAAECTKYRN
jgi:hypothetical protein